MPTAMIDGKFNAEIDRDFVKDPLSFAETTMISTEEFRTYSAILELQRKEQLRQNAQQEEPKDEQ